MHYVTMLQHPYELFDLMYDNRMVTMDEGGSGLGLNSRSFPGFSLIEQREIMKNIKQDSWCPG